MMWEKYFKSEKILCHVETACTNKSKGLCGNCSRNFNKKIRDWFEPTEDHRNLLKKIKR